MADEAPRPSTTPTPARAATPESTAQPSVTRRDLGEVIRRAAELSYAESDPDERLSEDEVIRIATELGMEPRHVWQALHERPSMQSEAFFAERYYGPGILATGRVVPGNADALRKRLESYLSANEFLTLSRRAGSELRFVPADDALSSFARSFTRPRKRHYLAHARRVSVDVRPIPGGTTHVRVEADLTEERRKMRRAGIGAGLLLGWFGGATLAVGIGIVMPTGLAEAVAATTAFVGTIGATTVATVRAYGNRFQRHLQQARLEVDGLLDRVESGERLEPPPAPWKRRLQLRLFGGSDR